ncbi:MAG: S-layer homology domain-containing protein [Epulopiscium sp.]|nr:S-layer homology domain-containing protein [Candidatus Epulonipiscium sp.]
MLKKIQIILFVIVLSVVSFKPSFAATDSQIQAGNKLRTLKILAGYEDGSLRLDNHITRAEIATILVRVLGYENTIIVGMEEQKFKDVKDSHWASSNIKKAAKLGLITGYPDGSFKPNQDITYAEITAMMVRITKQDKNLEGVWPYNYINKGRQLGIVQEENINFNQKVTRGTVAELLWNTLLVKIK